MELSQLNGTAKAVLVVPGIVFFFAVGLLGAAYLNGGKRGPNTAPVEPVTAAAAPAAAPSESPRTTLPAPPTLASQPSSTRVAANRALTPPAPPPPALPLAAPVAAASAAIAPPQAPPAAIPTIAVAAAAPPPPAPPSAVPPHEEATSTVVASSSSAAPASPPAPKPVAQHPPAVVAARAAPHGKFYVVQFGAFAREENARKVAKAVAGPTLKVQVTRSHEGSGLYLVRSALVKDAEHARALAGTGMSTAAQAHLRDPVRYVILEVRDAADTGVRSGSSTP